HGCHRALQAIGDAELPPALERYRDQQLATDDRTLARLRSEYNAALEAVGSDGMAQLKAWPERVRAATEPQYSYTVRGREVRGDNYTETLSHNQVSKLAVPTYQDWGDVLRFLGN